MIDDIDEMLKNKASIITSKEYTDNDINNIIYIAKKRNRQKRYIFLTSFLLVIIMLISLVGILNYSDKDVEDTKIFSEFKIPNYDDTIIIESSNMIHINNNVPIMLVIRLEEIVEYSYPSSILEEDIPITKLKAKVINSIKGEVNDEYIDFYISGGVVSIYDFQNSKNRSFLGEEYLKLSDEQKKKKFIKVMLENNYLSFSEIVVGNIYIVSLMNTTSNELVIVDNAKYPFNEYDQANNMVKTKYDWIKFE